MFSASQKLMNFFWNHQMTHICSRKSLWNLTFIVQADVMSYTVCALTISRLKAVFSSIHSWVRPRTFRKKPIFLFITYSFGTYYSHVWWTFILKKCYFDIFTHFSLFQTRQRYFFSLFEKCYLKISNFYAIKYLSLSLSIFLPPLSPLLTVSI